MRTAMSANRTSTGTIDVPFSVECKRYPRPRATALPSEGNVMSKQSPQSEKKHDPATEEQPAERPQRYGKGKGPLTLYRVDLEIR
jgi:hypothetical protein